MWKGLTQSCKISSTLEAWNGLERRGSELHRSPREQLNDFKRKVGVPAESWVVRRYDFSVK
jgi:adenine-specific DNA methylase